MKNKSFLVRMLVVISVLLIQVGAFASTDTWNGSGGSANPFWLSAGNWNPSGIPQTGDDLVFTNNISVVNSNNIPSGSFNSITFATPSGAFDLKGVTTTLTGGITNNQPVTTETIEFPIIVNSAVNVDVAANASLNLSNTISGSGSLSKSSAGKLTLNGQNTFAGPLTVNGGTVAVALETSLSAPPASPTAGNITLNGGALETTANLNLNANRGIAVGPTSGSGFGVINVDSGTTLTNGSIIANNGGTGGLTKAGFGQMILFGANTYTGPTTNLLGLITLDFSRAGAPQNNMINSASELVLGGATATAGNQSWSQLTTTNSTGGGSQTFSSTHIALGQARIKVVASATNVLGALDHDLGGILTVVPPAAAGGTGKVKTTSANVNGILGGWAFTSDGNEVGSRGWLTETNWAAVDADGNIGNYTGFTVYNTPATALVKDSMAAANNVYITGIGAGVFFTNALTTPGAPTTNDVNSIFFDQIGANALLFIGSNNVIRLGQYGGLFKYDRGSGNNWTIGGTNLSGVPSGPGAQTNLIQVSNGFITAGGPTYGAPGEIVLMNTSTGSGSANNWNFDVAIQDNGPGGTVSVIKAGSGYTKVRNHNTFTGSFYLLGGRIQPSGTDIGTENLQDAFGRGTNPIVVFPGGNLFWGGGNGGITNAILIAGFGSAQEPGLGALRGGDYFGTITLIGDAQIASGTMEGPISGPFNLTWCSSSTAVASTSVSNPNNSWSGNTVITAVQDRTGVETLTLSNSEVIPNGFGKGNVYMMGQAGQTARIIRLNMNGFSETVNGLSSSNALGGMVACTAVITNGLDQPLSTLTIGDNDQGGSFGGTIVSNISIVKIGAGVETLTNENSYIGSTTISNGVLQLSGVNASIAGSTNVNIYGGTLDLSGSSYNIPSSQPINVSSGTLFISSTSAGGSVNLTNGTLKLTTLNNANLTAQTINLGGSANLIQPVNIPLIDVYPKSFVVANYNALNGDTNTLGIVLPAGGFPAFGGYVTVDAGNKQIDLVMTNGPITPSLTWAGFNFNTHTVDGNWNVVDPNWTNKPAHTSSSYLDNSLLTFDDSAMTGVVNLAPTIFTTAGVTMTNVSLNYTFTGTGAIYSTNSVNKSGSGKLTLDNTGGDAYNGLSIGAGGIVQMGVGDNGGSLGTNLVINNGTLVFNRNNAVLTISNSISGSGSLLVSNATSTTTVLSGGSSFSGDVYVVPGVTLAPANANALSSTNGTVTIPTGTTLDVSGQGIAANSVAVKKVVSVSGAGVDSTSGAIVNNTTTNQQNALLRVTMTGNTTFGGSGRWDIRGTGASLNTSGQPYTLTKVGAGQFSLVGAAVDSALGNINVQAGLLSVELTTTGLGNTASNLNIANNATLQVYGLTNQLNKQIIFGNSTLTNANGNNTIVGPMTLNGTLTVDGATNRTLTLSNAISGSGSLTKNGVNTLVLTGPNDTYSGATTVNDGTLLINGLDSGSTLTENVSATTPVNVSIVGGNGTNAAPVDIEDTLWPGVGGAPSTFGAGDGTSYNGDGGALVIGYTGGGLPRAEFSLNTSTTAGGGVNDLVTVNGDLNGNFGHVVINPLTPLTVGTPYTLITYTGLKVNNFSSSFQVVDALQPSRYAFTPTYDTANKKVLLTVTTGAGNLVWNNAASTGLWTTNAADANWLNTGTSANDQFYQLDAVTFNDSIGAGVTTINIATTNLIPGTVTVSNTAVNYTFTGAGSIGGAANLIKQGTGTLTISNANTFTGTVTVKGGTVAANADNALGSSALIVYGGTVQANGANLSLVSTLITNGTVLINNTNGLGGVTTPVYVTNSGTLDLGGASFSANQIPLMGSEPIYISGWGVNSNGCLINSNTNGSAQEDAAQNIIMTGDAAIGGPGLPNTGPGRFDLGRLTNNPTLSTGGNPYNLYKVGGSQVSFVGLAVDSALADVDIKGGELGLETSTTGLGNPNNTVTVEPGAILEFFSLTTNLNKKVVLNGSGSTTNLPTLWFNSTTLDTLIGPITLTNGIVVIGGTGSGILSNTVSGPGGMLVGGRVTLVSANTYTGNTIVSNNGTLFLTGNATINNSTNISIFGGTNDLDVAGRSDYTLTLAASSSQTLSGIGIINGTLTVPSGTTLTVGTNGAVSQLTVTTNVNLNGTLNMKLDKGNVTNDVLAVGGQVNYGGVLSLNNLSGTLAANDSFKLFTAGTYGGTDFASITPAHPNNDNSLNWDTSLLKVSGVIKVVSAITPTPGISSISLSGTTLNLMATNGSPGGIWTLLQSTNVALPLAQWDTNRLGTFDGSGNLTTNIVNVATNNQEFYILKQ